MAKAAQRTRDAFLIVGGASLAFTAVCYVVEPDACAAVTVWPPWVWAAPGLVLTLIGCRGRGRRVLLVACCAWLAYLVILCEEPKSVLLGPVWAHSAADVPRSRVLRVVSVNCAGGSAAAAGEVAALHPDVVLLQESPSKGDVEALGRRLFGRRAGVAWGVDCSILADGKLKDGSDVPPCANAARLKLRCGVEVELMSIRLTPPVFDTNVWAPRYWREQAALRRVHGDELSEVGHWLDEHASAAPIIAGGDLNAPGWDGALKELPSRLRDTFTERGIGWGNTVLNEMPVLRFDQIRASREFRVLAVRAYRTKHSDHRMVVCDLEL
jgi:vancomycin resistance protein VanJ